MLRGLSGKDMIKALKRAGFIPVRQKGSHVVLVKKNGKKIGTVVPLHKELDIGTVKGILRKANVSLEEFKKLLD